jgi:hypothetical protein
MKTIKALEGLLFGILKEAFHVSWAGAVSYLVQTHVLGQADPLHLVGGAALVHALYTKAAAFVSKEYAVAHADVLALKSALKGK